MGRFFEGPWVPRAGIPHRMRPHCRGTCPLRCSICLQVQARREAPQERGTILSLLRWLMIPVDVPAKHSKMTGRAARINSQPLSFGVQLTRGVKCRNRSKSMGSREIRRGLPRIETVSGCQRILFPSVPAGKVGWLPDRIRTNLAASDAAVLAQLRNGLGWAFPSF